MTNIKLYDLGVFLTVKPPMTPKQIAEQVISFINWPESNRQPSYTDGTFPDDFNLYRDPVSYEIWMRQATIYAHEWVNAPVIEFIFTKDDKLGIILDVHDEHKLENAIRSFLKDHEFVILENLLY